ncbi:hypothetical protein PHMEG_0006399 [Phytophthora megakarya]|uniref:FYVE-type domain-containing protein n=1 Tax=Phytophthora megakarya TaxID=4795 RepID=A0A225WNY3_9STRA|nr:hypothetical protein PHMEG_0006399 [Phytophthora megakarya]
MCTGYQEWQPPFPPLQLSVQEKQECRDLAMALLDRTLRSCDARDAGFRSRRHHSQLDSARWRRIKTQTNASFYSERDNRAKRDLPGPGDIWQRHASLLAVGTIQSSLEEVMLGVVTPDVGALKLRGAALLSQNMDGATLTKLASPTEENPFQSMNIMWVVGHPPMPIKMVARPQDYIMLSTSGIMTLPDGERIGYDVSQPLQLPGCPSQPNMTRGKLLYGALYRETEDGSVDVFVQVYLENQCRLLDVLVMNALWYSVLGFWDAPHLAELKKLEWCLANREHLGVSNDHGRQRNTSRRCERCPPKVNRFFSRWRNVFRSKNSCAVCSARLCSSCCIKRVFKVPGNKTKGPALRDVRVTLCRSCLSFVQEQNPSDISWRIHEQFMLDDNHALGQLAWGIEDSFSPLLRPPKKFFSITRLSFKSIDLDKDLD